MVAYFYFYIIMMCFLPLLLLLLSVRLDQCNYCLPPAHPYRSSGAKWFHHHSSNPLSSTCSYKPVLRVGKSSYRLDPSPRLWGAIRHNWAYCSVIQQTEERITRKCTGRTAKERHTTHVSLWWKDCPPPPLATACHHLTNSGGETTFRTFTWCARWHPIISLACYTSASERPLSFIVKQPLCFYYLLPSQ